MTIFNSKKEVQVFKSAQEAYSYLFIKLQSEGIDIEKASERAFRFSTEYAERMELPVKTEIKEKGVKGWLQTIKTVSDFMKENPSIVEVGKPILIGAASAIFGGVAGSKIAEATEEKPAEKEPIVYDDDSEIIKLSDNLI